MRASQREITAWLFALALTITTLDESEAFIGCIKGSSFEDDFGAFQREALTPYYIHDSLNAER